MAVFRQKRAFTSGELSPTTMFRTDVARYKHGCEKLYNAYALVQGPATKRTGILFIADMTQYVTDLGEISGKKLIDFVFDEDTSYCLIFFTGATGSRVFFAEFQEQTGVYGLIEDPAVPGTPYSLDIVNPFDCREIDYAQSGDILTMVQVETRPKELRRLSATGDEWEITEPTFTDMPSDWEDPATAGKGWPSVFGYYEQRAMYGATLSRPQTLWGSKSGDFYDFGTSTPLAESDAITFTLASGEQNKILWISPARQLLVGTLGDEWSIWGAGAPLSFQSVQANRQTNRGSEKLKPIMIGSATIFLERLGRDVNEFIYDFAYDSYQINDLTILAPHLTEHYGIVDWAFQQTPNSVIWAIREDGDLMGLTYQRKNKVTGWHHHDTDGDFQSVCSTPNGANREDDVWFLVDRVIEGVTKYYLEVMQPEFKSDDTQDAFFVDSGLVYNGVATDTISGLDHLEGKTVAILTDGAVHAPQVVSSGTITLYKAYSRVVVGLPYDTIIIPTEADLELSTGTTFTRFQRVTGIGLSLYRSLGCKIGREMDRLEVIPFRTPSMATGQAVPLFSGIIRKSFPEGYDVKTTIIVVSDQPLPLTVIGIVDEIEVYE